MALESELRTYERLLPKLLSKEGQFALIVGPKLSGVFATFDEALEQGYRKFGVKPFLVKKIEAVESTYFVSRFQPCPHPATRDSLRPTGWTFHADGFLGQRPELTP